MNCSGCGEGVERLKCLCPPETGWHDQSSVFVVLMQDYGARLDNVSGRILGPVLSGITKEASALEVAINALGPQWTEVEGSSEGESSSSSEEGVSGSSEGDAEDSDEEV